MRHNFFQSFHSVTGLCKNRKTGGPHHDSLRNQIKTGKHQPLCTINPLCDRISKKSRIRAYSSISQAFIPILRFLSENNLSINHTENLNTYRYKQYLQILYKYRTICGSFCKCMNDITWKNHIDYQIIQVLLTLVSDNVHFFYYKSHCDQQKQCDL